MRILWLISLLVILAGCSLAGAVPGTATPLAGAEAITLIGTDKTLTDHIASFARGKDCSTIRVQLGQTYCVEDEVFVEDEVYCYKTIGKVTCYSEPVPQSGKYDTVGHKPASRATNR